MSTNTGVTKQLQDTGTGKNLYPITSESAVRDESGDNLKSKLGTINSEISELSSSKASTAQLQAETNRALTEEANKLDVTTGSAQTLTDAQKVATRGRIGLGNGNIDTVPTNGSANIVQSGGVFNSTVNVLSAQTLTTEQKITGRANLGLGNGNIDTVPTSGSTNLVESGGVFSGTLSVVSAQTLTEEQKALGRQNLGVGEDFDIDLVPTSGSTNLVESGGVFKYIADNTGAFDVSTYNSGATYSGLTEALNAVPVEFRKGGMSVKYVQTSDNKYVQYRLMADDWSITTSDWQGVDDEPTAGSHNVVESGGVDARLNEVTDIRKSISSTLNLKYDSTLWSTGTKDDENGLRYMEISGPIYGIDRKTFAVNGAIPTGKYHLFAKVKMDVQNNNNVRSTATVMYGGESVTANPNFIYANDAAKGIWLGTLESSGNTNYFYAVVFDNYKNREGSASSENITGKVEVYGYYIISDSLIEGITDFDALAETLDYSNDVCTVVVDGEVTKLKGRVDALEEAVTPLPDLEEDVEVMKSGGQKIISTGDISYNPAVGWQAGISVDLQNNYAYATYNASAIYLEIYQRLIRVPSGCSIDSNYAIFAKVRLEMEGEDADQWTADIGFGGCGGGNIEINTMTIKMNQDYYVYLGECHVLELSNYFYVTKVTNFRKNGQSSYDTIEGKLIYYGGYCIDVNDISYIKDRQSFAQILDYSKSYTWMALGTKEAIHAVDADMSKEAEHSSSSTLSDDSLKYRTALYGGAIAIFGDSLVTYSSGNLPLIGNYLGMTSNLVGSGGNQVSNNLATVKGGFCTIEALAKIRKDVKLIIFWGGANDGNVFIPEPARFGTINDQPLGVADMFNYRVTDSNFTVRDTPGRTQTFYQAYKTLLRNISILFPNALLVCCTQYRAYSYTWPDRTTVHLKTMWKELVQAEKECCAEYAVAVCDLFTTSGLNDRNVFSSLYDDDGSMIHPRESTSERCAELMLDTVLQYCDKVSRNHPVSLNTNDTDVRELKDYLVDLRSETECNIMTLDEAITAFITYTSEQEITLKNNMYMVFYKDPYYNSEGYFLVDKDNPTLVASWEQYSQAVNYDMRYAENPSTHQPFGALTLQQAANAFKAKADLELWDLTISTIQYQMTFYTDNSDNWQRYRLTNRNAPTSTSSWELVGSGQDTV